MTSPGHPQGPLKWSSGSHPTRLPYIFSPRGESISALINREVEKAPKGELVARYRGREEFRWRTQMLAGSAVPPGTLRDLRAGPLCCARALLKVSPHSVYACRPKICPSPAPDRRP